MPYTSNPDLVNLTLPFAWSGTPVDSKGRFINHEFPFVDSFKDLIKWQTTVNPQKLEKKNDTWRAEVMFNQGFMTSKDDCIVWLGHASYFIRLAGFTFLIDPVLFNVSLLRRQSALPIEAGDLRGINYILISHDHRDHCDENSLKLLAANNPDAMYLTGLQLDALLPVFTKSNQVQAAGWYQQYKTDPAVKVSYVPSRHWGRRFLTDTNKRLWGGFVIEGAGKTIYFGGDSGYGGHFKDIGGVFPDIDYCMLGIGAYKPEFFMAQSHTSPADAVRAFHDTRAKVMIPMHYGTFDLADEPLGDPLRVLKRLESDGEINGELEALKVGEVLKI
ncbi:MBL fold metallo-hydrolase [Emticicia sp. TH156]|uniref:MBL fold metallo-hydrolase n=1 Tax=Emticicia sp. TH156 TaxID=2067454 RepID=UPI000C76F80D|nr:MBL fold metallo-hydrolase [Emticicia sp. TH156]PLK45457.1 Zn-dependent hydrolase [Emticicia sp. TH156]